MSEQILYPPTEGGVRVGHITSSLRTLNPPKPDPPGFYVHLSAALPIHL